MNQKITRDDLEQQLRRLQGDVTDRVDSKKRQIAIGVAAAVTVVLLVTYTLGKRKGRKKMTYIEIRRV